MFFSENYLGVLTWNFFSVTIPGVQNIKCRTNEDLAYIKPTTLEKISQNSPV